ncbi:hypothetical protein GmHk_17G049267 [Glycine max]|nr:hypothetical protein GmHk_17G049267 [Glycine max]
MGSPPASTPPPPPPPPPSDALASPFAVKRTPKSSRLRSLSTRPPGAERPVVHVDPNTGKPDGPHKKKLRTYLGIMARDKVDVTYKNWKEVPTAQKDLIWEDIQAEFDILEASDSRTKRKLLQTVGERWRQFKSDLTRKWAVAADQDGVEDIVCEKYGISKEKWAQLCQTRRDPSWEDVRKKAQAIQKGYDYLKQKLLAEKTKKKLEEAAQSGSIDGVIDDSFEEQATQGSFVPHGCQDVLAAAIGRPEHPGHVRAAGAGVTIKQYFGSAPRTSRSTSSLPPDELQQLTQQIRDQLEESIIEKVTRQVMASFSHMQSQLQSQMQSQGLAVPPEPLVGPSGPRVCTKGSCVDPSGNDPETDDSDRCGLYIKADLAHLVVMGRVYEGSTVVHNTPLLLGQVKVSVEEVIDADAPVLVPTDEVSLVGHTLHTFLAWPTHLVKSLFHEQVAVSPAKPPPKPDLEVDDPLYLMTLTIPELFLRPYQVRWDVIVFGVFNPDFPLYIKHEDLSEIAHGGQCLSISVLQLWILHLTETCMRVRNSDIYGFLEPQPIQRSGQSQFESESYIKSWMPDNYLKRTPKSSRLRSLSTRPPGAERPVVHVDPNTGKPDGPHKKKLRTYLGIMARDKVDVTYKNWKEVPTAQKDLIWEDIQAEFDILEASDSRTKRKLLQTVGERWRQFKSDLTRKWAVAADQDGVEDIVCEKYGISKEKWAQLCQTRRDPSWEDVRKKAQAIQKGYDYLEQKLLAEKTKKKLEEAAQSGSIDGVIDVNWKMARTKKTGEMTTEAAKEITEKIDSFEEQATQGSFVPHGCQDVLAAAIGRPEHPGHVRAAGAGVTIKQYFGSAPRTSRSTSSLPPDELQQLTQQIRDQLEESIIEKVTRQVMASFSHMQSQLQSQMQSQGLAVPPEPLVGPSGPRVCTKGSCVDPSGNDPETDDSDRCGLYIKADPAHLVVMGRVYEGSTVVHNTPLLLGQVKVSVEEVIDADAPVLVPTDEVSLVGQTLHTFLAWPTHLVKSLFHEQVAVSPAKPPPKPDLEVDDPLYLMTLTIPELFLRPYQVRWDVIVFGVFNPDFPLYIKHEDLSEIAHGGQCLSISVLQLWILHLTETCMRVRNSDIYGFLEPQPIQRSGQSQFESESYL